MPVRRRIHTPLIFVSHRSAPARFIASLAGGNRTPPHTHTRTHARVVTDLFIGAYVQLVGQRCVQHSASPLDQSQTIDAARAHFLFGYVTHRSTAVFIVRDSPRRQCTFALLSGRNRAVTVARFH